MNRNILSRVIVAIILGLVVGYAIGRGLEQDAERGRNLTLKEYVSEFEAHKQKLAAAADSPIAVMVFSGVVMMVLALGVYELLVLAVDRVLGAVDRRRNAAYDQPGTPPPW